MKETDVAKYMVDHFKELNYEVYQEVTAPGGGIVDIVAKIGNIMFAVEVKTSLSLAVLAQAFNNKRYFHYSSICIPSKRMSGGSNFARQIARDYGIGVFELINGNGYIDEVVEPKLNRKSLFKKVELFDEQKDWAEAGNADGKRYTTFGNTRKLLINYVTKNEGCKMKDALKEIKHHYRSSSSANTSLSHLISINVIDELEKVKGKLYLKEKK